MRLEKLKGMSIALLGFGIENISFAKYLIGKEIDFVILDQSSPEELSEDAQELICAHNLKVRSGKDYLSSIKDFDVVVRSPGVKYLTSEVQEAKKAGVEITSSTKLFFENAPAKIIGVTGTKGKGTTASLITEIVKAGEIGKVHLVGNIGLASFDVFDSLRKDDIVVFELSSFQLQDIESSPWISVIVNLTDDHLDYHQTLDEYRATKHNVLKFQKKNDYAILNFDYSESRKLEKFIVGKKYFFSSKEKIENGAYVDENGSVILNFDQAEPVCNQSEIKLIGRHNLENIAAASLVGKILNIPIEKIKKAVVGFSGLPHRLEHIRDVDGVEFYNDSFSTNPTPTIAAIRAFSQPITIILGGSEKGADFGELARIIKSSTVKNVLTIGIEGPRIRKAIENQKAKINILNGGKDIDEIVEKAFKHSDSGDIVLFSPACASFDIFKNYKDRGEKFKHAVREL